MATGHRHMNSIYYIRAPPSGHDGSLPAGLFTHTRTEATIAQLPTTRTELLATSGTPLALFRGTHTTQTRRTANCEMHFSFQSLESHCLQLLLGVSTCTNNHPGYGGSATSLVLAHPGTHHLPHCPQPPPATKTHAQGRIQTSLRRRQVPP